MATATTTASSTPPPTRELPPRRGLPPGPRAKPVIQTLIWALAPTWMMDRCAERIGEAFTITFAPSGMKMVLLSDPEAVKTVFTASPDVAPSATGNSPIAPIMGPSSVLVLPAGTRVAPSIYLTNRNPRAYTDPTEFQPERFLGSSPETFSWIPFGGGIRRCIGASFAQLEMKVMLRTMLAELEPSLPPGRMWRAGEWTRRRAITLVPAAGAKVVWRKRAR